MEVDAGKGEMTSFKMIRQQKKKKKSLLGQMVAIGNSMKMQAEEQQTWQEAGSIIATIRDLSRVYWLVIVYLNNNSKLTISKLCSKDLHPIFLFIINSNNQN